MIMLTGSVCLSACWDTPPRADTPSEQTPPRADTPGADNPPGADTPTPGADHCPRADIPPEQTPPEADIPGSRHPPRSRLQHTVYERPVRILLECILVKSYFHINDTLAQTHSLKLNFPRSSICSWFQRFHLTAQKFKHI